jgi:hypothetical protein
MIEHEVVSTASETSDRDLEQAISELQNRGAQVHDSAGEKR